MTSKHMTKKKVQLLSALILFLVVGGAAEEARAIGIAVTPSKVHVEVVQGEEKSARLHVRNPSGAVVLVDIYPDELEREIKVTPSSFVLEAGKTREVLLQVRPREEGIQKTTLSVVSSPLSDFEFSAGAGIKVPLTIETGEGKKLLASLVDLGAGRVALASIITITFLLGLILLGINLKTLRQRVPHIGQES